MRKNIEINQIKPCIIFLGVSEYPFADGDRFPKFLETARFFFPDYCLNLRHIRDVDGHFVTIEEYQQRVRK